MKDWDRSKAWSKSRKRRHSLLIKKKWRDSEYARAASKGLRTPWSDERRESVSRKAKERWQDPKYAKRILSFHVGVKRSAVTCARISKTNSDGRMRFSGKVVEKRNKAISSAWTKDKRDRQSNLLTTLSSKEIRRRLKKANPLLRVVSVSGRGSYSTLKLLCKCGHKWKEKWSRMFFHLGRCPQCSPHKVWISESRVRKTIEKLTGWRFPKARPEFLKGRGQQPMELDGYNKKHQVAFEYQGEGHYLPVYGEKKLKKRKLADKRKRMLCSRNGVFLICVPYWKDDIEGFLKGKLEKVL
jgi:hypothetical protein